MRLRRLNKPVELHEVESIRIGLRLQVVAVRRDARAIQALAAFEHVVSLYGVVCLISVQSEPNNAHRHRASNRRAIAQLPIGVIAPALELTR